MTTPYFDDDDIECHPDGCPSCGCDHTWTRTCWDCNGDGFHDLYEDDPLWYDQGDTEDCGQCDGTGTLHWCRACGYDFAAKRRICVDVTSEDQA